MPTILEQLTSSTKSNIEAQHAINADLGIKMAECLEEFTKLNTDAIKASMEDSANAAEKLFHSENPQQFAISGAGYIKQEMQSAIFYCRELMRIGSSARLDLNRAAAEWIAASSHCGTQMLTDWIKNAPVGTDRLVDTLKSAWGTPDGASANNGAVDQSFVPGNQASRKKNDNRNVGKSTH